MPKLHKSKQAKKEVVMENNKIKLFEDLLGFDEPENMVEHLDRIQSYLVCNCSEFYAVLPELYTTLQILKVFFLDVEKLRKENN